MLTRFIAFACVAVALGCGGSKTSGSPTAPTPQPAPAPTPTPPPPAIAQVAGTWRGSFEVKLDGVPFLNTMEVTLQQTDRVVRGSWRTATGIRTPDANAWFGDITGTIALASNGETTFVGSTTLTADTQRGVGSCRSTVAMEATISSGASRWTGPTFVQVSGCRNNAEGLVWVLSKDGGPTPPTPTPTPTPTPPEQFSCTASLSGSAPAAATLITFDEPEIDAVRTLTESNGSYASCPYRHSNTITQFSVKGASLQGSYTFRGLWNGCTSSSPAVWDAGVLQARSSVLTIGLSTLPRPTALSLSLGVDGSSPSPQFTLTVTDGAGATANATVTTLLGRATLSCTNPIASVSVSHDGPLWIMDSLAF